MQRLRMGAVAGSPARHRNASLLGMSTGTPRARASTFLEKCTFARHAPTPFASNVVPYSITECRARHSRIPCCRPEIQTRCGFPKTVETGQSVQPAKPASSATVSMAWKPRLAPAGLVAASSAGTATEASKMTLPPQGSTVRITAAGLPIQTVVNRVTSCDGEAIKYRALLRYITPHSTGSRATSCSWSFFFNGKAALALGLKTNFRSSKSGIMRFFLFLPRHAAKGC